MTVTYKAGNLLQATEPVIAHGVNCKGAMGAGVALAIRRAYGESMYQAYRLRCERGWMQPGTVDWWLPEARRHLPDLVNVASQCNPGADARIDWLAEGMLRCLHEAKARGHAAVAVPRIGCGIGGLNWEPVQAVLITASLATGIDLTVYIHTTP